jgi:hypothetical protein
MALTNGILNREFGTHHDYISDSVLDTLKDLIIESITRRKKHT